MKRLLIVMLLGWAVAQAQDSILVNGPFRADVVVGYQGLHLTGYSVHAVATYDELFSLDAGYGFDYLNSITMGGRVQVNRGPNQFSLFAGYGVFFHREPSDFVIRIRSVHIGVGYQSVIWDRFVVGQSVAAVKYLDERFSIPDYKVKQVFDASEGNYFEVGISLGYRFYLDELY